AGRALDPDNTNVRTMAMQLAWKTGDFDKARAELETMRSEHRADIPTTKVWFELQLGLMALDQGRWEEAEKHYLEANAIVSGWWLVEEHLAEVRVLANNPKPAIATYEALVAETDNP